MQINNSKTWMNCRYTAFINVNAKGIKLKATLWWLSVVMVSLSGCSPPTPPIPQEGDIVTWSHGQNLIIKAKLGQRREHVKVDPRTDHLFYEPEYEQFIGQFPIDYNPQPFPRLTEQEHIDFIAEDRKKIKGVKSIHSLQFNLMLNGVKAKATDRSIVSDKAMDDINQIRVEIGWNRLSRGLSSTEESYQYFLKTNVPEKMHYDKPSSDEYGMNCYKDHDDRPQEHVLCFGESTYEGASGVFFTIIGSDWVLARSNEPIYGGIQIKYRIDRRKLKHWKEVDAAIWRLLERWNISPLEEINACPVS